MSIKRTEEGVWMQNDTISVARMIVEQIQVGLGYHPDDYRTRDKMITLIADYVNLAMDKARGLGHIEQKEFESTDEPVDTQQESLDDSIEIVNALVTKTRDLILLGIQIGATASKCLDEFEGVISELQERQGKLDVREQGRTTRLDAERKGE